MRFIGKSFVADERMGERISKDVIAHCRSAAHRYDTRNCQE